MDTVVTAERVIREVGVLGVAGNEVLQLFPAGQDRLGRRAEPFCEGMIGEDDIILASEVEVKEVEEEE